MSINSKHPSFAEAWEDWMDMRDFYAGEKTVKEKHERYLPATSGMRIDGMQKGNPGYEDYCAYVKRAVVPDYVSEAVEILVGLLHQKEPTIELPDSMKPLITNATLNGESLVTLMRRINVEQLITGRVALLADLPSAVATADKAPLPYIALYCAESVINWDDNSETDGFNSLNMVVIDESKKVRANDFEWQQETAYKVLQLGKMDIEDPAGSAVYRAGTFTNMDGGNATYVETEMVSPTYKGKTLTSIPFAFINSKDILAKPDAPPLRGLQKICEAIYRMEADYRQNLYMQAQDTLVVIGGVRTTTEIAGRENVMRTGAGSRIDVDTGGDAKYIGVSADGLAEQRIAIENDKKRASIKAGELIQSAGSQQESGTAMQTRFTAQTATLNQISLSGARGLENVLKAIALWMGEDPAQVIITPNTEFVDFGLDGLNFVQIMTAKQLGMPISIKSIHAVMADRGMTTLDFDTEVKQINDEVDLLPPPPAPAGSSPAEAEVPHKNPKVNKPAAKPPQKAPKQKS